MTATETVVPTVQRVRYVALDKARGLAMLVMILDHMLMIESLRSTPESAWLLPDGFLWIRLTLDRVAMPLFMVIGGMLIRRLNWSRIGQVAIVGFLIPIPVWFIDDPNILLWYAMGVPIVYYGKRFGFRALIIAIPLTYAANFGYPKLLDHSFDPTMVWALMALGSYLTPDSFRWANRLPNWFSLLGGRPLTVYCAHLLILTGVLLWLG